MYFLIDLENVNSSGLNGTEFLDSTDCITICFSKMARMCRKRNIVDIEKAQCYLDFVKLVRTGKNGLDFYIASKIGEYYGSGGTDQVAIISKDTGYTAIQDYWKDKLPKNKKIIVESSIQNALSSEFNHDKRKKCILELSGNIDLDTITEKYEAKKAVRSHLVSILNGTGYERFVNRLLFLLSLGNMEQKDVYYRCVHEFGKDIGSGIYKYIKDSLSDIL